MIAAREMTMNSFLMQQAIRGTGQFMFALGAGFSTGMLVLAGSVVLQAALQAGNTQLESNRLISPMSANPALPFNAPFDAPFNVPFGKLEAVANAIKPRAAQVPNRILF